MRLPETIANGPALEFDYCCIGTGGFTGGVSTTFATPPTAEVGGFEVSLERVGVRFQRSQLIMGEIEAVLKGQNGAPLPFFDTTIGVDLQIHAGGLKVAIAAAPGRQLDDGTAKVEHGLVTLHKPGIVAMTLESAELEVHAAGGALTLSGTIIPEVGLPGSGPLPPFGVKALTLTSAGEVSVSGGWIDMPDAVRLELGPFGLEITQAALGSEPGGERWVGFSGALSLATGVPITASVDGLRIRWDDTGFKGVDLAGIGLKMEIEGVLRFSGSVRFLSNPERFEGTGSLELTSIGLTISAQVVIGKRADYTFLYFYLLLAPPVGIPIFNTGLAFYSFEALYARHMEPNKAPSERWFHDWYRRPELGAADRRKWADRRDSQAFGAGVTIGTFPDKGYAVAMRGLLVIVVPGPIILLDARANLLKEPTALARPDAQALFSSLVVYDGRQGTLEVAIEPHYVFPESGELVDVTGIAEAFYSFNDPRAWHIYLGKREPEQRIRATLLSLFEANAYLMIEPDALELGGFIGYEKEFTAGPAKLTIKAFIEAAARVSWRPKQLSGHLHLEGSVGVSVCGIGLGVSASATLAAQAPKPFAVRGDIRVKVDLPWPIPDLEAAVELAWEAPGPPRLTVPLQAGGVEHQLVGATWPFDGSVPIVPMDGRISLAFDQAVNDVASVGANAQAAPDRPLGDYLLRSTLEEIAVDVHDPGATPEWKQYATTIGGAAGGPRRLYGMWQVQPGDARQGNRRLQLWVRTPYEWMRPLTDPSIAQLERAEGFSPCEPMLETRVVTFDDEASRNLLPSATVDIAQLSFTPGRFGARLVELATATARDRVEEPPPRPYYRCLHLNDDIGLVVIGGGGTGTGTGSPPPDLRIDFPADVKGVAVLALAGAGWSVEAFDCAGQRVATAQLTRQGVVGIVRTSQLVVQASRIRRLHIQGGLHTSLLALAIQGAASEAERATARTAMEQTLERFKSEEPVFEPGRRYRLRVRTSVSDVGGHSLDGAEIEQPPVPATAAVSGARCTLEQAFEFRVEGPPGASSVADAGLATLEPYVRETQPARGSRAVYRHYDLGAAFRADYVDHMYRSASRTLIIELRADDGTIAGVANTMGKGNEIVLRREERTWLHTLSRTNCQLTLDESKIVRESAVRAQLGASPLAPRRRYDAVLVGEPSGGGAGARTPPLYMWSFTTSAYLNFVDHFSLSGPVRDATIAGRTGPDWAVASTSSPFESIFADLAVERPLPQGLELHRLVEGGKTWGVLLSSPEPFATERVRMQLVYAPTPDVDPTTMPHCLRWDADGTRAILVRLQPGGVATYLPPGSYVLLATFRRDLGVPGAPVLSESGSVADETAEIAWEVPAR